VPRRSSEQPYIRSSVLPDLHLPHIKHCSFCPSVFCLSSLSARRSIDMARPQMTSVCLMMLLALAALATHASAADHMKAPASPGRKLHSTLQAAAADSAETSLAGRRKLAATDATQQRSQRCGRIPSTHYCGGGTQFNCCSGENSMMYTGCGVHDNNYVCPSSRPLAVCCWA